MSELLTLYSAIMVELRSRKVTRTANNPVGDYAEWLAAKALRLELAANSQRFDAMGESGIRYEIKGIRKNWKGKSPQFGAFRNLPDRHFDKFVAVSFEEDFRVERAVIVPYRTVVALVGPRVEHTNSYTLQNHARLWTAPTAVDVTARLRRAQRS